MKKKLFRSGGNKYIISLNRKRSFHALIACIITVSFSLYGIVNGLVGNAKEGKDVLEILHYFTTNANALTAMSAFLIIPFAVEGIRKKHFSYPKWLAMLHYCGTVCTTLTMAFAVGIISWFDSEMAFGGNNLYLHVVCPLAVLISFFLVEAGYHYTRKTILLSVIPIIVYEAVYGYEVLLIGEENGGWPDLYHVAENFSIPFSIAVLTLTAFLVAAVIRWGYNKYTETREKSMEADLWPLDVEPVEIKTELFGLGRYYGLNTDIKYAELPMDIINLISVRYGIKKEELIQPYSKGFFDGLDDGRRSSRNF